MLSETAEEDADGEEDFEDANEELAVRSLSTASSKTEYQDAEGPSELAEVSHQLHSLALANSHFQVPGTCTVILLLIQQVI